MDKGKEQIRDFFISNEYEIIDETKFTLRFKRGNRIINVSMQFLNNPNPKPLIEEE